ncbi:BnaC03g47940D [Brassica napus]|uniref:BnaC03g47940D protein n=2 Tax=Brassica napus TaxID=3708 RepID=A0A078F7W6_BRANA|nr:BnaC03g47940D [Brassica napus]
MSIKSVRISLGSISPEAKVQATKVKAREQDTFTESISRWPLTLTHMPLILTPQIIPSSETEASAGCGVALCFLQLSMILQRFVEAANAFLRRSKAKRSVMSSEVVDAQKEVSRQGKD